MDLVGVHLEVFQGAGSERCADGDISGIPAARYQDAPNTWCVVTRVEYIPMAVDVGFEPGSEIHYSVGRRNTYIAQIAGAVSRRDIQAATQGDSKMSVVTAHSYFFLKNF